MGYAYASGLVEVPAEEVWDLVRRFDGLAGWHPMVAEAEMLDGADPHAVGARRRHRLANGEIAHARLASLDDDGRTLVYEMLDGPFPVRSYFSTIRVAPVTTAPGSSFVEWWGRFDADEKDEAELVETFGSGVFEAGVRALQDHFAE